MKQETDTRKLVLRLQSGNLDALGEIYDLHQQMVYRTALAITGDAEAAADLLQDVFLRFNRFIERVDPERPLEPWLLRMTSNLACTWVKRQRWMRPIEELADWLAGDSKQSPARMAEISETWGLLEGSLKALPLNQRTVLVMHYINGLPIQEISEILDVPLGTVKSRLHYGRVALKREMDSQSRLVREMQYEFT